MALQKSCGPIGVGPQRATEVKGGLKDRKCVERPYNLVCNKKKTKGKTDKMEHCASEGGENFFIRGI